MNVLPGEDPRDDCNNPVQSDCDGSGGCEKENGVGCSAHSECGSDWCIDDVCCENQCLGLCKSCNETYTDGSSGDCLNVSDGEDPDDDCNNPVQSDCDGTGACEGENGTVCSLPGDCGSDFCENSVCCDTECICGSCAPSGTCGSAPYAKYTDPEGDCTGVERCNGSGACGVDCGDRPPPTGSGTPAVCTSMGGGGGVCNIECATGGACASTTLDCPAGFGCNVTCSAPGACANTTINCPAEHGCDVSCTANNTCSGTFQVNCSATSACTLDCTAGDTDTCNGADLNCGNNSCESTCSGGAAVPTVNNCSNSCDCSAATSCP